MFADVMVRVIGVSYFTSYPAQSRSRRIQNLPAVSAPLTCPEHHRDAGDVGIPLTVHTGVLFSSTLFNPSTGPSTGLR